MALMRSLLGEHFGVIRTGNTDWMVILSQDESGRSLAWDFSGGHPVM